MKKRIQTIADNIVHNFSTRRLIAMLVGNLILGFGCGGLKLSLMGNDSFNACMMAISEAMGVGQGTVQLVIHSLIMIIELIWGYHYIGLGTFVNMGLLGYVVQYSVPLTAAVFGDCIGRSLPYCLMYMSLSLLVISFGLSMYQVADMGIAPYDYLSLHLAANGKRPYFFYRVLIDCTGVAVILIGVLIGLIPRASSHLGIGTVMGAFCLGPIVSLFNKFHQKWIR